MLEQSHANYILALDNYNKESLTSVANSDCVMVKVTLQVLVIVKNQLVIAFTYLVCPICP